MTVRDDSRRLAWERRAEWPPERLWTFTPPANPTDATTGTVKIGSRTVPYWEAGLAYLPYAEGYFGASSALTWGHASDWVRGTGGAYGGHWGLGGSDGGRGGGGDGRGRRRRRRRD